MNPMRGPRPYSPEPVDPEEVSPAGPYRALKQFGLVLLCAAWVALGLAGHDPWKTEDAMSIGIAAQMADRGEFAVPLLAGEPYLPQPPLAYWAGAVAIKAFAPPLQVHNAARLAAGVALALVLLATAWASRELNGRAFRWLPVLILVGSVGYWDRAHVLSPELVLTAGVAVALYGIRARAAAAAGGGVALGVGIGIAFLARGLLGPAWIVIAALLLPAFGSEWRQRAYAVTLAVALVVALALSLPWPLALHARDPALFELWWQRESLGNLVAFFGPDRAEPLYYLRNLVWFAWPALPLILWMLWLRVRGFNGGLREPGIIVPGVLALVMLASLLMLPEREAAQCDSAARAAGTARRAGSRFAEARLLRRARLVRHPDLRPAGHRVLGLLDRLLRARHGAQRGAPLPRHRSGLQAVVPSWARSSRRSGSRSCGSCSCARRGGRTGARSSTGPPA